MWGRPTDASTLCWARGRPNSEASLSLPGQSPFTLRTKSGIGVAARKQRDGRVLIQVVVHHLIVPPSLLQRQPCIITDTLRSASTWVETDMPGAPSCPYARRRQNARAVVQHRLRRRAPMDGGLFPPSPYTATRTNGGWMQRLLQ